VKGPPSYKETVDIGSVERALFVFVNKRRNRVTVLS
jgi:hypothetical protein